MIQFRWKKASRKEQINASAVEMHERTVYSELFNEDVITNSAQAGNSPFCVFRKEREKERKIIGELP